MEIAGSLPGGEEGGRCECSGPDVFEPNRVSTGFGHRSSRKSSRRKHANDLWRDGAEGGTLRPPVAPEIGVLDMSLSSISRKLPDDCQGRSAAACSLHGGGSLRALLVIVRSRMPRPSSVLGWQIAFQLTK